MSPEDGPYLFLGVGGMGMAPLAAWMAGSGFAVTGCDDDLQEPVRRYLVEAGVELRDFLLEEDVEPFATVVHSSAVPFDHLLLAAARQAGAKCMRRGELLALVSEGKRLLAVAGSHGKTTTSGLIAYLLKKNSIPANHIVGGFYADPEWKPHRVSDSDWLVAEIDESDGTIDAFSPEILLLLNADWDHADRYADSEAALGAFAGLAGRTSATVLLPQGMSGAGVIAGRASGAVVRSFGPPTETADGWNECAASAAAGCLDPSVGDIPPEGFPGMQRREQVLLESPSLSIVEDYAHHPTEIRTVLARIRKRFPGMRIEVVFQPHRYSRTRQFKKAFGEVLADADGLHLLPVYGAYEEPLDGGRTEDLRACFKESVPELLPLSLEGVRRLRCAISNQPCVVAFLGAGDINFFARLFAAATRDGDVEGPLWEAFLDGLVSTECRLKLDEPLAKKTTLRVGGAARFFAEPSNLCDLRALLRSARLFGLPVFSLGRGSNLLVADEGFEGLVIRFSAGVWRESRLLSGGRVWAGAGVRLKQLCGTVANAGLGGFEFLEGIPGAVGGALRMNAGAMGSWTFDLVERVQLLDAEGRMLDLPRSAFHFGYRKVDEISRGIALGAVLRSPGSEACGSIRERMDSYSSVRKGSQPRDPSAGCIFKNPDGSAAGKLIDESGAKGLRVGDAEVSPVHANFIVNRGSATAGDILSLIRKVRARVEERTGVLLEPEVLLVGADWPDALGSSEDSASEEGPRDD